MKRARVHLDATQPGSRVHAALCGLIAVDTEVDITLVTCKLCQRRFRAQRAGESGSGPKLLPAATLAAELASTLRFQQNEQPKAGPPPVMTPGVWGSMCGGHLFCGHCAICEWEKEAERWADRKVSAHNVELRLERDPLRPQWPSLNAALVALAEHEAHDRWGPSAMGPILDRASRGDVGDRGGKPRTDDPLLERAGRVISVRQALDVAYPDGGHPLLGAPQCKAVLMARTPGTATEPPPAYELLAERYLTTVGDLRAVVKHGRRTATVELAARGLIPDPKPDKGLAEAVEIARGRYRDVG